MCGIIAIMGRSPAAPRMVESLRRLEYRGYDSAGVAVLRNGAIERRRAPGKLQEPRGAPGGAPAGGRRRRRPHALGHARRPDRGNAHPHVVGRVALVHNGIIENFAELKAELEAQGRVFDSQTDTEVVAQLIDARARPAAARRTRPSRPRSPACAAPTPWRCWCRRATAR